MKTILIEYTPYPVANIYCIGRSYYEHIHELGNTPTGEPVVFLKPTTSLTTNDTLHLPSFSDDVHHEVELVLYIGSDIDDSREACLSDVKAYGVGLDLTARDVQSRLKAQGLPWTLAKGFRDGAYLSPLVAGTPSTHTLFLAVNEQVRQHDTTDKLMYDYVTLLNFIHRHFGLRAGDLIYTGTPSGVGRIVRGDVLTVGLDEQRFVLAVH